MTLNFTGVAAISTSDRNRGDRPSLFSLNFPIVITPFCAAIA
ncbi:MAG: hypothetical protein VKL42_06995 [Snowella sp.]|nr:hypothetical protein [Snowella sp.]